jgi:hypothetical protein
VRETGDDRGTQQESLRAYSHPQGQAIYDACATEQHCRVMRERRSYAQGGNENTCARFHLEETGAGGLGGRHGALHGTQELTTGSSAERRERLSTQHHPPPLRQMLSSRDARLTVGVQREMSTASEQVAEGLCF